MRRLNEILLNHAASPSAVSVAVDSNQLINASFQAIFSDGAQAGTFKIQASNDPYNASYNYPEGQFAPTNWTDIPNATASITSGSSALITLDTTTYRWLRCSYTSSGGAGTILVNLFALSY